LHGDRGQNGDWGTDHDKGERASSTKTVGTEGQAILILVLDPGNTLTADDCASGAGDADPNPETTDRRE